MRADYDAATPNVPEIYSKYSNMRPEDFLRYIEETKKWMIQGNLIALMDAVITENNFRMYTAQLRRRSLNDGPEKIKVTTDSPRTAKFVSLPFVPSTRSECEVILIATRNARLKKFFDDQK